MIRRSTLVFLTCLSALSVPAAKAERPMLISQQLVAQADDASIEDAIEGDASNVLSIGDRGPAVRSLQIRLQETDYYDGPIDGIYGLATQRSVRDFQENQGFDVTGRLDNETWEALEATNSDATAADSDSGGTAEEAAASTEDSAEALPVSNETAPVVAANAEPRSGGLGKVFGWGIGLVALVSSFGVGFFIANRSKDEAATPDGDGWSEIGTSDGALPATNQAALATLTGQPVQSGQPAQNGNVSGVTAAAPGSALSTTSGQMGGTALMAQSDVVDGLIKDLHNPDPTKRRKVIWELGQRGNSLAVNPLVDAMVTADSKEKSLVLAALSEIGIRSLKPMNRALAIALQDENPEVRKNAIRDLSRIYELVVQISQMLGHATEDEDPEVRQTATWALEQLNRIRKTQDVDSNMRAFPASSGSAKPIDLLSSEASIRRSQSRDLS